MCNLGYYSTGEILTATPFIPCKEPGWRKRVWKTLDPAGGGILPVQVVTIPLRRWDVEILGRAVVYKAVQESASGLSKLHRRVQGWLKSTLAVFLPGLQVWCSVSVRISESGPKLADAQTIKIFRGYANSLNYTRKQNRSSEQNLFHSQHSIRVHMVFVRQTQLSVMGIRWK